MIGRLQRYATDYVYDREINVCAPAKSTGRRIAVIGAGPAGLSCAGELARRGHEVTLFEKRELPGGLSTYGIVTLREPVSIAIAEVRMIERLGVAIRTGYELCRNLHLPELLAEFEAVFLSVGLGHSPQLGIPGEEQVLNGLAYIEQSKLSPEQLPAARRAVVIGAGNTAIDCATIARRLGAEVTIVYRRSEAEVSAYRHEIEFIRNEGVVFQFLAQPVALQTLNGSVTGLECVRIGLGDLDSTGRRSPMSIEGSEFVIPCDQVIKAIGQERPPLASALGLATRRGFIDVNARFETSLPRVFAGGDCIRAAGACSTVMAVQDGKLAARAIHNQLTKEAA
jgi:glutamate synthase (NADPH/NADH) small chain